MTTDPTFTPVLVLAVLWLLTSFGVWIRSEGRCSLLGALWGGTCALVKHSLRLIFWIAVGWIVAALLTRKR